MKRCPTCGLALDDSQTFCTNDGTPLTADNPSYDPQATLVVPPGALPTAQSSQTPPMGQPTDWQSSARPTAAPQFYGGAVAPLNQPVVASTGKFVPGLIGGVVTSVLCLFADFLPVTGFIFVSFLCIVWSMIGGAVAARLYVKRSSVPVRQGTGALVGMVAGGFGAILYLVLDTLIAYALLGDAIEVFYRNQGQRNVTGGIFFAVTGVIGALMIFGLSVIGGIIGVAMFEKRTAYPMNMPPPPPLPGYGGPSGNYR